MHTAVSIGHLLYEDSNTAVEIADVPSYCRIYWIRITYIPFNISILFVDVLGFDSIMSSGRGECRTPLIVVIGIRY